MRKRPFVFGLTLLVCAAAFAQTKTSNTSNSEQAVGHSATTARETGSGMATGKQTASGMKHLEQKNIVHRDLAARQASGAGTNSSASPAREAGSGMATGRREAGSGMATGKREAAVGSTGEASTQTVTPRDVSTGQASGKRQHGPVMATEHGSGLATGKAKMSGAQSNPMYKDDGKSGTNPLYESKDKRVQSGLNTAAGAVANGAAITKSRSNIQNNRVAAGDVNGDGKADTGAAEPQKATINTTRSNIKHQQAPAKTTAPQ